MTQAEARALLHKLTMMTVKGRSNVQEAMNGFADNDRVADLVLQSLIPNLFPTAERIGLVQALTLIEKKPYVEKIDMYNILFLVKTTPLISMMGEMWDVKFPEPLDIMKGEWEERNDESEAE